VVAAAVLLCMVAVGKGGKIETNDVLIALIFGIIGMAVVAQAWGRERGAKERASMKRCPQCAEYVQRPAKVCRFCGHQLGPPER
jgi:rRNA maturation endonuclease Nob1